MGQGAVCARKSLWEPRIQGVLNQINYQFNNNPFMRLFVPFMLLFDPVQRAGGCQAVS